MQTMLRMVGFGDNAGSGFLAILATWKNAGWMEPMLKEDTRLNQVTLILKMVPESQEIQGDYLFEGTQSAEKSAESAEKSADKTAELKEKLSERPLWLAHVCKLRSNGMPVPLLRNGYSIFNGTKYR